MNEEEKKHELPKFEGITLPLQFKYIEKIKKAVETHKGQKEMKNLLLGFFKDSTQERFDLEDEESKNYLDIIKKHHLDFDLSMYRLDFFIGFLSNYSYLKFFWEAWGEIRGSIKRDDLHSLDAFIISLLYFLEDENIIKLNQYTSQGHLAWDFVALKNLAENELYHIPDALSLIGKVLVKLGKTDDYLSAFGRDFLARSQALKAQEELEENTLNPFREEITKKTNSSLEKIRNELKDGLKEAKENETRMTRNFVQIIGIFAAIIAFVVTIVPTAVRLGGASIPIALAGLAIVTVGIIVVLALIFGNDKDRRKSLKRGFWALVVVFLGWLGLTVWLAIEHPTTLVASEGKQDTAQSSPTIEAENLYMVPPPIDSVQSNTTPPPSSPSTREGE